MRLAVFDFDGTLARTFKPAGWAGSYWSNPASLEPPHVPEHPGPEFWIQSTVGAARAAIADSHTLAILMTGRLDKVFRWRVPELLSQARLHFDAVHLSNGSSTESFKKGLLERIFQRNHITEMEIWEDRPDHLKTFMDVAKQHGIPCIPHLVKG